jgi:hypothetical protein
LHIKLHGDLTLKVRSWEGDRQIGAHVDNVLFYTYLYRKKERTKESRRGSGMKSGNKEGGRKDYKTNVS